MHNNSIADRGREMAEKERQTGPAVKELPTIRKDEIDEIVEEFLKEEVAEEAEQAARREERRGE